MSEDARKRRRDQSPPPVPSSPPSPSLLPSSPPAPFSDVDFRDEEEEDLIHNNVIDPEDLEPEDGEDLFGSDMAKDYRPNIRFDQYDPEDIDDEGEYAELDLATRRSLEAKMAKRDEIARSRGRVPAAFLDDLDDDNDVDMQPKRRHRKLYDADTDMNLDDENIEMPLMTPEELRDVKTSTISEWVTMERVRRTIAHEFKEFLLAHFDEHGTSVYGPRIKSMGEMNHESLLVSYNHLIESKSTLAYFLANSPVEMLEIFDRVALEVTLYAFPEYTSIHEDIHVRITDLPTVNTLRELRKRHLNTLVRVSGVVSRRSSVFPQLRMAMFICLKCGMRLGPFPQEANSEVKINLCQNCQSRGPFELNQEDTVYRNFQKITLQESPGTVPAGRLPRHREVILLWDLIDSAKPGDEIEVTGIYHNNFDFALNVRSGFPVFATVIEANYISKKEDMFASYQLTEDDKREIQNLAKDPRIGKRIFKSIAPSIFGHEDIKRAIALALFGGEPKNPGGKHQIRGDINVLMLGDPGTAKSQFLKYVENTAHRSVFTTGQGASAVGLTASVRKDTVTREWTLEGGALVLADNGVCLIDEFDKMNDQDRTSIHEAMEQQSISISKAGIVTTLQARCSIIAAANPIRGRYDTTIPFAQNVELTEPILSRFDVLCVVKDTVDANMDDLLSKFVISSHIQSHPNFDSGKDEIFEGTVQPDRDTISQELLRKYIMYAREKIHPKLEQIDRDKLARVYSELRRESLANGSLPITVRHFESMIRMAESHAKMHLREYVRSDDVDLAIQVMLDSFISAQKHSLMKQMKRKFSKYVNSSRDHDELLYHVLNKILNEKVRIHQMKTKSSLVPPSVEINLEDFDSRARELDVHDTQPFFSSPAFLSNGFRLRAESGIIVKAF